MKWYYIVGGILFIKIILNLSKFIQCKYYLKKYKKWLGNQSWVFLEKKIKVSSLIKGAGLSDCYVPYAEPIGYGYIATHEMSVLNNFPHNRRDIAQLTVELFHNAIGVYKSRMYETVNPLFWIETFIYLPKTIFTYLGAKADSFLVKSFQILWWIIDAIIAVLIAVYHKELSDLIKPWFLRIFENISIFG